MRNIWLLEHLVHESITLGLVHIQSHGFQLFVLVPLLVDEIAVVYHHVLTLVDHSVALPDAIRIGTFT